MLTAIVLTATGIVSVFFMCMAYAANTDSKTNAYETACSVTVIAGVTIMVYFQAVTRLPHMAAYDLASVVMLTSATAVFLKRPIKDNNLTVLGLRAALLVICLPAIACLMLSFSAHV